MRTLLATTLASLAACGGGTKPTTPDAAKLTGFDHPTAPLMANMLGSDGNFSELGPADLSCLGTPTSDMASTVDITLNVHVADFQQGTPVASAMVTLFDGIQTTSPFTMGTADANGDATFTVPKGRTRFGFEMTTTDGSVMPTFLLNQYLDPSTAVQPADSACTTPPCKMKIQSVSVNTAQSLPALIGEVRATGTGVLAGALRDCQHHEMSNFIATVSSTSGTATPLMGAETYYFSHIMGGTDLPVQHNQHDASSSDGLFVVFQLPPTQAAYVQRWGYPTMADVTAGNLKLIAELKVPVVADTVITGSYEPLRQ